MVSMIELESEPIPEAKENGNLQKKPENQKKSINFLTILLKNNRKSENLSFPTKKKKLKVDSKEISQQEKKKLDDEIENLHLEKLPLDEMAIHEKHDSDEDFEANEDLDDFYEGDDFLFDLSLLSKKDLKSLKKLYPNLPEYYFKTPDEKRKFFSQMNKKYFEKLKKEKTKIRDSKEKKVEFNPEKNQTRGLVFYGF